MSHLHFFSLTTVPIETFNSDGTSCTTGTGFFYRKNDNDVYLITNWHIVTARDTSKPHESKNGAIPSTLQFAVHQKIDAPNSISLKTTKKINIKINDANGNDPQWLEHPHYKYKVDVVAIKCNYLELKEENKFNVLLDYPDFEKEYQPEPMADIFVIGYPWKLSGGNGVLPLYKRGSVASDPLDFLGLPRFLIDCRTASGMSGSPTIVSHSGIYSPNKKFDNATIIGTIMNFAGVYSGRLKDNNLEKFPLSEKEISEIGIVWKRKALDEIVANGVRGSKLSELITHQ